MAHLTPLLGKLPEEVKEKEEENPWMFKSKGFFCLEEKSQCEHTYYFHELKWLKYSMQAGLI